MLIAVTGASGFLGTAIARELIGRGHRLRLLARSREKAAHLEKLGAQVVEGDVLRPETLEKLLAGVETVVHSAGFVSDWAPEKIFMEINVDGTVNVARAAVAAQVGHFVHISSFGVYGSRDYTGLTETGQLTPSNNPYDKSKFVAEERLREFAATGLPLTIMRIGFIYGPGDRNFMPRVLENLRGGKVKYVGDGNNVLTTTYLANAVSAIVAAVEKPQISRGQTYHIADGQRTTSKQFFEAVAGLAGLPAPSKHLSPAVAGIAAGLCETVWKIVGAKTRPPITKKMITFLAKNRDADIGKAACELGYRPIAFEEAIKATVTHVLTAENSPKF